MTRIRVGLTLTIIVGAIYAAAGLFSSLIDFAIGTCVAAAAVAGYGLVDFIEAHDTEKRARAAVWSRRDSEVAEW